MQIYIDSKNIYAISGQSHSIKPVEYISKLYSFDCNLLPGCQLEVCTKFVEYPVNPISTFRWKNYFQYLKLNLEECCKSMHNCELNAVAKLPTMYTY